MLKLIFLVLIGLADLPNSHPVEFCQYGNGELCCTWTYMEVGCVDEFLVEETWCLSSETDYTWVEKDLYQNSWHDRYIEDNCRRCPDCCVRTGPSAPDDRAELEDIHCTPDVCPGPDCPCVQDDEGIWWINETLSFDDDNIEEDRLLQEDQDED